MAELTEVSAATNSTQHSWLAVAAGRIGLSLLSTGLLTAAFAPVGWFFLAWIGVVPWLIILYGCRSVWSAAFWSWWTGTLFFIANMWWMAAVTAPGMVGLMVILGLYWGATGVYLWLARLTGTGRQSPGSPATHGLEIILVAAGFVAICEWFRGTWPWHGLPWLYLGYTQSPWLRICQITDITGIEGLSFLIVAFNVLIARLVINRQRIRPLIPSAIALLLVLTITLIYGSYRMSHERLHPGPVVMVVQPNFHQDNSGEKGARPEELVDFHLRQSTQADPAASGVDLIVWSETMLPAINPYAVQKLAMTDYGELQRETLAAIGTLCRRNHTALLAGGEAWSNIDFSSGQFKLLGNSNVAYFFDRRGRQQPEIYAKIHLVPFGEFIPFKEGCPPLYRLMIRLGPKDMESYGLNAGNEQNLLVDKLTKPEDSTQSWRFVTPICFEDIDADLCARMFRPDPGTGERKRADFLVNITNDGWFLANENAQHLQAAIFRSIENRVSTARAVNTGVSGFVDPVGNSFGLIGPRREGVSQAALPLDDRVTFFTRFGQLFARVCAAVTLLTAFIAIVLRLTGKMSRV